ncbi:MAG: hypothetical protein KGD58_17040 [Candidatus Lokiarchaeota archaeon]|nr:hypothetical protein [Candidatus Lokiarchaeota archaeon]
METRGNELFIVRDWIVDEYVKNPTGKKTRNSIKNLMLAFIIKMAEYI